ncbi:hypothetical protein SAMN02745157_0195 [Kaistia soli DSM 19436]|uniref:Uncharacterized protein n=1 Tax=Kaistia soli DSM 19436 TaxID=1122133 RepID=A0A1M5PQ07_9HYPH|nr:hypothetical protein SAMN02745157_0195 [Kaistia soli DSM 19436]
MGQPGPLETAITKHDTIAETGSWLTRLAPVSALARMGRLQRELHIGRVGLMAEGEIFSLNDRLILAINGRGKGASLQNARRRLRRAVIAARAFGLDLSKLTDTAV